MLPVAATCSQLLELQSCFLTHRLFQSLAHGATGHRVACGCGWCQGGSGGDWGESWPGPSTESSSVPGKHYPEPEEGNLWLWGRIMQMICLVPVLKIPSCWFTDSCLGAIFVPSQVQTVLSINTGNQNFTISPPSDSPEPCH